MIVWFYINNSNLLGEGQLFCKRNYYTEPFSMKFKKFHFYDDARTDNTHLPSIAILLLTIYVTPIFLAL